MGYNFNSFISFVTLENTELRLPEDDADASQNVGVLINIIDIYIYMCVCVCVVYLLVWTIKFQFIRHVH